MGGGLDSKEIISLQPSPTAAGALQNKDQNKDISQELQDDVNQMIINDKENIYNGTNVTTFAPVSTNVSQNNYGYNKYLEEQFTTDPTLNYTINGITYDQFGNDLTSDLIWED